MAGHDRVKMRYLEGAGRAVVVGAVIAGLATGCALRGLGYEVCVFDREPELRAEGAGLTLWPNATRALGAIGLDHVIPACARVLSEVVALTPNGGVLSRLPMKKIRARFGPLVSAYRPELLSALHEAFDGDVHFG